MDEDVQPIAAEVKPLADGLGMLVHNTLRHHWFSSTDERETLVAYFALLTGCLTRVPEVVIRVAGDALLVNDVAAKDLDRATETLVAQIKAQQVNNIAFRHGVTLDDLGRFVAALVRPVNAAHGAAAFQTELTEQGVAHIGFKTVMTRELGDDDVIVSRKALAAVAPGENNTPIDPAAVLAFLAARESAVGHEPVAEPPNAVDGISRLAEDTKRLAALVLQAARARPVEDGGMAGALVVAMNRAFDVWSRLPGADTATGKKRTQKNLRALERDVLSLLDTAPEGERVDSQQAVKAAVGDLEDDVHVDVLATEYLRRLKSMEQTEKRLQRYLNSRGGAAASGLLNKLQEGGVTPGRLQQLAPVDPTVDRRAFAGRLGGGGDGPADGAGAGLSSDMTDLLGSVQVTALKMVSSGGDPGDEIGRLLQSVQEEIRAIMDRTAGRIRLLTDEVKADAQGVEAAEAAAQAAGKGPRLTRRQLLEMLAEIVQELCQPLAVVQCSVDMITSRMLGEVSTPQMEMLKLVTQSVEKLQSLITGLRNVAGVPDSFTPDRALIDRVERPRA